MACSCCVSCGTRFPLAPMANCACGVCGCTDGFTLVQDATAEGTLIDSLTKTVDNLRDIYTQFGARQYQVLLVWTRWSGGERGLGGEDIVRELPLLPTPMISSLDAVRRDLIQVGIEEAGQVKVTQLSPRLNEDLLVGKAVAVPLGTDLPEDMNFYWEIFFPRVSAHGVRRRFIPKSAPNKNPTKFEWTIELLRASGDRGRDARPG